MNRIKLSEIKNNDPSEKEYFAHWGDNMGNKTLGLELSIKELLEISQIKNAANVQEDQITQRSLNQTHAKQFAIHILVGLMQTQIKEDKENKIHSKLIDNIKKQLGNSPYAVLQPLVCNIEGAGRGGANLEIEGISEKLPNGEVREIRNIKKVYLGQTNILSVVDGQHRRKAFDIVYEWLQEVYETRLYPPTGLFKPEDTTQRGEPISSEVYDFWGRVLMMATGRAYVKVECHLGLNTAEEQQLFSDLNSKGKKIDQGLAYKFDKSDPVLVFIHDELIGGEVLNFTPVEKDKVDWHKDVGTLTYKELKAINTFILLGKSGSGGSTPKLISDRAGLALKFWDTVQKIKDFGGVGAKSKTVAAQSVVLKGIAKLAFDLGHGKTTLQNADYLVRLWEALEKGTLDFSHKNKIWRSLMLTSEERNKAFKGIDQYVYVKPGTNLDAGTYDEENEWVRYGAKHNDILARIGDLIRYQLKFDPRPDIEVSKKKDIESNS